MLSVGCLIHIYRKYFTSVGKDDIDTASDAAQEEATELTDAALATSELSSPEDHLDPESISRAQ